MTEALKRSRTAQQPAGDVAQPGSRKKAGVTVAVLVVVALLVVAGLNSNWLTARLGGEQTPPQNGTYSSSPELLGLTVSTDRISPLSTILITCEARDPDGDQLTYMWSASGGEIIGEGPEIEWRAPDTEGIYRAFVLVEDGKGGSVEESVALRVRYNQPPEILFMTTELGGDDDWVVPGAASTCSVKQKTSMGCAYLRMVRHNVTFSDRAQQSYGSARYWASMDQLWWWSTRTDHRRTVDSHHGNVLNLQPFRARPGARIRTVQALRRFWASSRSALRHGRESSMSTASTR